MPGVAPAVAAAIISGGAGLAGGAASVIASKKAAKEREKEATRFVLDPVLKHGEDDFASKVMDDDANLTLRPGGRPIIFPTNRRV